MNDMKISKCLKVNLEVEISVAFCKSELIDWNRFELNGSLKED